MGIFVFFQNRTTDGTSPVYEVQDGGFRIIKVTGTFGGATVTFEVDFDDNDYAPIIDYIFTQSNIKDMPLLKPGTRIAAVISGSTGTTDITVKII